MGQVRERDLTRACEEQLFAKADAERRALEWETKSNVHAAEITDLRGQLEAVTKAHAAAARAASEAQDELARATEDKARQARQLEVLQVTTATQLSDLEAKDRTHREALATARRDSADKIAGTPRLA